MTFRANLSLLLPLAAAALFADQTPIMFRGDAAHTGAYPASGRPVGKLKWKFETGGKVRSTPAILDGRIYFGSDDARFYALDEATGKKAWDYSAPGPVESSAAITKGRILFEAGDKFFIALDLKGKEKWRLPLGEPIPANPKIMSSGMWEYEHSSAVVEGDTAYFGAGDGILRAIDISSGRVKWTFATKGRIRATPAYADGAVFLGSMDGNLYCLNAEDGSLKWKFKTTGNEYFPMGEIQSSPMVSNGMVYFGSRDSGLYALDAKTGAKVWMSQADNGSWIIGGPAAYKDLVIVTTSDAHDIRAYSAADGALKWKTASPGASNFLSSPNIFGDFLAAGDFYGTMLLLNAGTGKLIGGFATDERIVGGAIIHNSVLYFGSEDNFFYAVGK
ncbi:MAG: PQQ-binding-like beta-propeller repeat protein [Armatimonadetes bacterium]|nr:PQQ-binding-like beta-propeller repeat protein [Armatimonadota bacterium]